MNSDVPGGASGATASSESGCLLPSMTAVTPSVLTAPIPDPMVPTAIAHTKPLEPEDDSSALPVYSCSELLDALPSLHTSTPSGPRLPVEILEEIIDSIASLDDDIEEFPLVHISWTTEDVLQMLSTLCLVCRALVPRCRLYMYNIITLRSQKDLSSIATTLSNHPHLVARIQDLTIDARLSDSQAWISAIPLSLPLASMGSIFLQFRGVDLTQLHPSFPATCTMFGGEVLLLNLVDVQYTRYSQITRLVRAVRAKSWNWTVTRDTLPLEVTVPLYPGRMCMPHYMRKLDWRLTWDMLDRILQALLSEDRLRWHCRYLYCSTEWPPSGVLRATYGVVLEKLVLFYQRTLSSNGVYFVFFSSGPFRIEFKSESHLSTEVM